MTRIGAFFGSIVRWGIFTAGLAAIVHVVFVFALPSLVMGRLQSQLIKQSGFNTILHAPRPNWESRQVVRPSPDLLYSICAYNLSLDPVRIIAEVPDSYWSLSMFTDTTDNYFVVNDLQTDDNKIELILAGAGTRVNNPEDLPIIESPTFSGVILLRTLITSEDDYASLDKKRRQARCETYAPN